MFLSKKVTAGLTEQTLSWTSLRFYVSSVYCNATFSQPFVFFQAGYHTNDLARESRVMFILY